MILNKPAIERALSDGRILFLSNEAPRISTSSIDVRLGDHIYRYKDKSRYTSAGLVHQETLWLGDLKEVEDAFEKGLVPPVGGLHLDPGECVLAHTHEFVGGTDSRIVAMIKDRSTLGRFFLTTHTGAGWGDVGYHNRWTMEIRNSSPRPVVLPPRARVAQIVFMEGEPVHDLYTKEGAYQRSSLAGLTFEQAVEAWNPASMLPVARW